MEELFSLCPGRYRHFKGNEYELLYVARHSETLEPMVVYRASLYGERGVWVRPAAMWSEAGRPGRLSWPPFSVDRRDLRRGLTACKNIFQIF